MSNLYNSSCGCSGGGRGFDDVWQRVLPDLDLPIPALSPRNTEEFSDEEFLRAAMDKCCSDGRAFERLACRCPSGAIGRACRCLARQEGAQFNRLRTAYFILSGERYTARAADFCFTTPIEALRALYLEKVENSRMYLEAAELTSSEKIACICRELAEEEHARSCDLEALIRQMIL